MTHPFIFGIPLMIPNALAKARPGDMLSWSDVCVMMRWQPEDLAAKQSEGLRITGTPDEPTVRAADLRRFIFPDGSQPWIRS